MLFAILCRSSGDYDIVTPEPVRLIAPTNAVPSIFGEWTSGMGIFLAFWDIPRQQRSSFDSSCKQGLLANAGQDRSEPLNTPVSHEEQTKLPLINYGNLSWLHGENLTRGRDISKPMNTLKFQNQAPGQ